MEIEVIGIPFDGYGRNGHQALAAQAVREAGLVDALAPHSVGDGGDVSLPAFETERGPQTHLLNEPALLHLTEQLNVLVQTAVAGDRFPLVVGGDCSLLLGVVTGLRDGLGGSRLMFVDGHQDTMPLDVSEDGEAANCEIGLLLGLTGRTLTGPLAARLPALEADSLAILGQRDDTWRREFNVGSLADLGVWSRDLRATVADPTGAGREAAAHLRAAGEGWWMHVDLDVLDPLVFPAQGLPGYPDEPGGLDWGQLTTVLTQAAGTGGCLGMSVTIYDPDQDPERSGALRIVELVGDSLRPLA